MRWRIKLAKKKPEVVYGGPYAAESNAIIAESRKEKPNYDALITDWETVSNGALAFIEKNKEGFEKPVGEFVENVIIEHPDEPEVPPVHLYASNEEVAPEDIEEVQAEKEEEAKTASDNNEENPEHDPLDDL
jgi:hypothetical protein